MCIDAAILQEHFPEEKGECAAHQRCLLLEFIHRRGCIDITISRRATSVKDLDWLGLYLHTALVSSVQVSDGIASSAALHFNSVSAFRYQCAGLSWKK